MDKPQIGDYLITNNGKYRIAEIQDNTFTTRAWLGSFRSSKVGISYSGSLGTSFSGKPQLIGNDLAGFWVNGNYKYLIVNTWKL